VLAVELTHTTNRGPAASTTMPSWRFLPADANRPWASRACMRAGDNFTKNPPCLNATAAPGPGNATTQLFTQRHLYGKEHSTAILAIPGTPYSSQTTTTTTKATTERTDVLFVSTSSVLPAGEGDAAALAAVRAAATAGLAALALHLLGKRPVAAGVLIGLLAIKPQLAVVFPFVLIATRAWRTFAAAAELSDGRMLVASGYDGDAALASVEVLAADGWAALPPMATARSV
jgi:hypothetical protein